MGHLVKRQAAKLRRKGASKKAATVSAIKKVGSKGHASGHKSGHRRMK